MIYKTFIVAEAGINHNGSIIKAKKLVIAAKKSGADAIKFQSYKTDYLIEKKSFNYFNSKKKNILKKSYNYLKKFELSYDQFKEIKIYCKKKKIIFFSTPFDIQSLLELKKLKVNFIKIASGDINNFELLDQVVKIKKPIIISTGRSSIKEIIETVKFLRKKRAKNFTLLYCVSTYPTKIEDLNLNFIKYLKKKFNCNVGFSDHSLGILASIASIAIGAKYIEKHITLNKNDIGPDHKSSLEPDEFKKLVEGIRAIEKTLGLENFKKINKSENFTKFKSRRGIYTKKKLYKNETIKKENIICKRPYICIGSNNYLKILGKKVNKKIEPNKPLFWNDISKK